MKHRRKQAKLKSPRNSGRKDMRNLEVAGNEIMASRPHAYSPAGAQAKVAPQIHMQIHKHIDMFRIYEQISLHMYVHTCINIHIYIYIYKCVYLITKYMYIYFYMYICTYIFHFVREQPDGSPVLSNGPPPCGSGDSLWSFPSLAH